MKKNLTRAYVSSNRGCYSKEQVDALSFMKKEKFTLTTVVKSEIPLKDKFWFVINKGELTTRQYQDLAIGCAEVVLEIYESKYPNSKAPREAIQAAKDFLAGIITIEVLRAKRKAAYAAGYAATTAYAAYAAYTAYAAATVYVDVNAATNAANAAKRSQTINKVDYSKLLFDFLLLFIKNNK